MKALNILINLKKIKHNSTFFQEYWRKENEKNGCALYR